MILSFLSKSFLLIFSGSLSFAALDSVPPSLVDNAAIVGTVSLVVAALFLLDMGGPKRKKPKQATSQQKKTPPDSKTITKQVYEVEKKKSDRKASAPEEMEYVPKKTEKVASKTDRNGRNAATVMEMQTSHVNNGAYFICLI